MEFAFEVGTNEKHHIRFRQNWFTRDVFVLVDNKQVIYKDGQDPGGNYYSPFPLYFSVGVVEKHHICIEPLEEGFLLLGRRRNYRVLVDGKFDGEYRS